MASCVWLDAVEYDDELVVMVGDRVHVLAGLGFVAWLALASPRTLDELVAEATPSSASTPTPSSWSRTP